MTTIRKTVRRVRGRQLLIIHAELRQDNDRGLSDAFSITADLYEQHGMWSGEVQERNGREPDCCGCLHDEIAVFAPELQPLIDIHLADPDGIPMHAKANGWYWYSGQGRQYDESKGYGPTQKKADMQLAADALNIPVADLPAGMDRDEFDTFADSLVERWREQAIAARELLERLP